MHLNTSCVPEMYAREQAFLSFGIKLVMAIKAEGFDFPTNRSVFL